MGISNGTAFPKEVNEGDLHQHTNGLLYRFLGRGADPFVETSWIVSGGSFAGNPDTSAWGEAQRGAFWFNSQTNSFFGWDGERIVRVGGASTQTLMWVVPNNTLTPPVTVDNEHTVFDNWADLYSRYSEFGNISIDIVLLVDDGNRTPFDVTPAGTYTIGSNTRFICRGEADTPGDLRIAAGALLVGPRYFQNMIINYLGGAGTVGIQQAQSPIQDDMELWGCTVICVSGGRVIKCLGDADPGGQRDLKIFCNGPEFCNITTGAIEVPEGGCFEVHSSGVGHGLIGPDSILGVAVNSDVEIRDESGFNDATLSQPNFAGTLVFVNGRAGTTAQRPTAFTVDGGFFFDTDFGRPIWKLASSPSGWVFADGLDAV